MIRSLQTAFILIPLIALVLVPLAHETMTHSLPGPLILVSLIGLALVMLGYLFDAIKPCRRYAPLCRFMCLGIILGCTAGLVGEFAYDFIQRWLFRNVPIPSLARLIDVVFDLGYARYFGIITGAAGAIWVWWVTERVKREREQDSTSNKRPQAYANQINRSFCDRNPGV